MTPPVCEARHKPASACPVVAWSAAGLLVALAVLSAPALSAVSVVSLTIFVGWIAIEDLTRFTIPDAALGGMAAIAAFDLTQRAIFVAEPGLAMVLFTIEGIVCGGTLLLVREVYYRRRGHDGVGFGDVKLAGVGGLLCGVAGFSYALLAASLAGLTLAGVTSQIRSRRRFDRLPFGALLAPAFLTIWLLGVGS